MKKILFISSIFLSLTACNDKNAQPDLPDQPVVLQQVAQEKSLSDYEQAKATLDELFLHAERLKKGEISKERHDAISYPIGQKFRSQRAALNEEDRQKLSDYGLERFDEVYPEEDRKVVTGN